jgi:integrase
MGAALKPEKKHRGVYEHPKGSRVYWCQYFADGKRHRERAGNKSTAISLYQTRKAAIRAGEKLPVLRSSHTGFGELLDDLLRHTLAHNKTHADYVEKAALVRKQFGSMRAAKLTAEAIEKWIDARGIEAATFNRYKAFFSLCFRLALRAGKADMNPATLIFHRREPAGRKRYLTREEYVTLLGRIAQVPEPGTEKQAAVAATRALAFLVSVFTGMRSGEQFSIDWSQVDFERGEIHLTKTKNGEDRDVPMVSLVRGGLAAERDRVRPKRSDKVFPRPRKGKGAWSTAWFEAAVEDCGIDDYTWHNNRHTFCSWHAIAGTPLKTIQELAGHKTITTTARYAHLCPSHRSTEAERIVQAPPKKRRSNPANFATATKTATGT